MYEIGAKVLQAHEGAPRPYQVQIGDPHGDDSDQCARLWLSGGLLTPDIAPSPVMARCNKCGFDHPLSEFKTLKARCEALGIEIWGIDSLDDFTRICAQLAEKGVTAEQFVEGL